MTFSIPAEVTFILHTLQCAGYDAYIVGGAVRDLVLQLQDPAHTVSDYDFTTNATPEQLAELFPDSFYENTFGTVSVTLEHIHEMMGISPTTTEEVIARGGTIQLETATKIHPSLKQNELPHTSPAPIQPKAFEITTYRSEGTYSDHRRPEEVSWGKSILDDLSRRDFTINAMALSVNAKQWHPSPESFTSDQFELLDPYHGQQDLAAYVVRTVGEPAQRFQEDALRMLRAIRFTVQLNMKMDDAVFIAISATAADIQHVSWERIRDEFFKMLASKFPAEAVELLEQTGLLHYILPELLEGKGVEQGGHHTTDVWTHSIDALRECPSTDPIVRFATLLHDIAKPRTYQFAEKKPTFYNHEVIGARIAKKIAERFRLSKRDRERIFILVRQHMFYYQPEHTDAAIRRFMRNVGLENINDILDLREADRLGSGARKTSWRLEEMKARMVEQLHQPFSITDLKINGNDLMSEFHLSPGRLIGKILNDLFQLVLEHPEQNTRESLLENAKKLIESDHDRTQPQA